MSYKIPKYPVAPGTKVADADMEIIRTMPVKSIITRPGTGQQIAHAQPLLLRGHAWSGTGDVAAMHVSFDFGSTWVRASLSRPKNRYAWQLWELELNLPRRGYYEIWARATDSQGRMQPMLVPGWNPRGYLNNAMQRIAIRVV